MSWVTFIWAMLIGLCVAMVLPNLLVGVWQRRGAHLFFVLAAVAVAGMAAWNCWRICAHTRLKLG